MSPLVKKNPLLAVSDYEEMMLTGRSKNLKNKTQEKVMEQFKIHTRKIFKSLRIVKQPYKQVVKARQSCYTIPGELPTLYSK